jgi:dihydroflavonol-4-reductase
MNGCQHGYMILITGATGYLGSVVAHRAHAAGYAVRALVRDPRRAEELLPDGIEIAVADLLDLGTLRAAASGCSAVLHLGGTVGGDPELIHRTNVEGTRAMVEAASAAGVGRFVHTSTGAAVLDADGLIADHPAGAPALTDPYSASKAASEEVVRAAPDMETVIVRPTAVYGPSPRGPQSYNGLFLAAARGEVPAVVDAAVGWVLAEDCADGHLLALTRGEPGRAYVLCGEVATFGRVLGLVLDGLGAPPVHVAPRGTDLGPDAATFAARSQVYGMRPPVRVDDRGARALGFRPRGVDAGAALTVDWLRRWHAGAGARSS